MDMNTSIGGLGLFKIRNNVYCAKCLLPRLRANESEFGNYLYFGYNYNLI